MGWKAGGKNVSDRKELINKYFIFFNCFYPMMLIN